MHELPINDRLDKQLVREAARAYVDWREECVAVWDAFDRWAGTSGADAAIAFSAYRAALDREECASHTYADLLERIAPDTGRELLRSKLELCHSTSATGDSPQPA
jgi:hypothetical protein